MSRSGKLKQAEPLCVSKKIISDYAEKIAKYIGYEPGDDIYEVINTLGGHIIYVHSWKEFVRHNQIDGTIVVRAPGDFDIFLASFYGMFETRFTLAHELGHYFLHSIDPNKEVLRPGEKPIFINRAKEEDKKKQRVEWEANRFAEAFLR